jgi:NAD-dependent dihydropyrimidine dehydrogenase PreA subunit
LTTSRLEPVYDALAAALDALPNAFPRTKSGVELEILRRIFSPEEARLGASMGQLAETAEAVAGRCGLDPLSVAAQLKAMAKRGLVWPEFDRAAGSRRYRLAPFIVGIYEAQLDILDHDLAHLLEHYFDEGGAEALMSLQPAFQRVVPAVGTVAREWILPYEDVVEIVRQGQTYSVRDCICRVQKEHVGRHCDYPLDVCLTVSPVRRPPRPGDISLEQALAVIDRSEQVGLVHSVSNVASGLYYVCNCCGCCCGILRGVTERGIANSVARANYFATVDVQTCTGCEVCVGRCQVGAVAMTEGVAVVDRAKCIGCGLCVSGCPGEAARLEKRPDAEAIHPPADFAAWESERLRYRQAHQH